MFPVLSCSLVSPVTASAVHLEAVSSVLGEHHGDGGLTYSWVLQIGQLQHVMESDDDITCHVMSCHVMESDDVNT